MQFLEATQDLPFKLWQHYADASGAVPQIVCNPYFHEPVTQGQQPQAHDCVVVAAGIGSRMKADRPKQYLDLAGHTLLEWTVCQILQSPLIKRVVLVLHPDDQWFTNTVLQQNPQIRERLTIVHGGKERVDSVCNGLKAVESPWCLVHDAARPFVHLADIERLVFSAVHAAEGKLQGEPLQVKGAILACPETDTLKRIHGTQLELTEHVAVADNDDNTHGQTTLKEQTYQVPLIAQTEDRSQIYRAQTPQMFPTQYLLQAILSLQAQGKTITDEASVVDFMPQESALLVEGSSFNFKLTTPQDLVLANALINFYA